jgi:peptidase S46-like protein
LAAAAFSSGAAFADEGLWTFDNFPAAAVRAKYGVTIDQAWLDHVQHAAVRLSTGCSASVVSPDALVLTNQHCISDCIQALSTPQQDYIKSGFIAASNREERLCPGVQAEILTSISDVTGRISRAVAGKTGPEFVKSRDAAITAIEQEDCAGKAATLRCQVVTLYQGGQYKLYTYHKYSDVRLVFAPEFATTFFGGDPDNFNFPRYDLECSFVRLYEQGQPVRTPDHLRWNPSAPKDGEPVFVAGNPGSTQRQSTADQLSFLRNVQLPQTLLRYSELRGRLIRFGEEGPEQARVATPELFDIENSYKERYAQLLALDQPGFIEAKHEADLSLKARVDADPGLKAIIGDPWSEIAQAEKVNGDVYAAYELLERAPATGSDLYSYARALVRSAAERRKPNSERLPDFTDSNLPLVEKDLTDAKPIDPKLEQLELEFWLTKVREYLTADAPETHLMLGRDSPEELSRRLASSRLIDPELRKQLWAGGWAAVSASDDPLIRYVIATDPAARELRKTYEEKVGGPVERAQARIAKARFAIYGTSIYPDATFTLRLSYGKIAGWTVNDHTVPSFTYFSGLYERATGKPPFQLAPRWVEAQPKLNPATVFNISSTTDIVPGNSGSPLLNVKGEVIGTIFDGNIYLLGGTFAYDGRLNRAVTVSTAAITEALETVYQDHELVKELSAAQ